MAMAEQGQLEIEVAYAQPDGAAHIIPLTVPRGSTIEQAIRLSGILARCPEIDLGDNRVGVFSSLRKLDDVVGAGDRIEIYRRLIADPKEARRRRADREKA